MEKLPKTAKRSAIVMTIIRPILNNYKSAIVLVFLVITIGIAAVLFHLFRPWAWVLWCLFLCLSISFYLLLYLTKKNWKLELSRDGILFHDLLGRQLRLTKEEIRWRLIGSRLYDEFILILRSNQRKRKIILQPHWENALTLFALDHDGSYSDMERYYLNRVGFHMNTNGKVVITRQSLLPRNDSD